MNGIYLELKLGNGSWSDTKNPIYLGVYGRNGGREFALQVNNSSPFTTDGTVVKLIIGQPCCNKTGLQVDNSQSLKENDPLLIPMNLSDIEFVYIRKYGGETSGSDDWAEFSKIVVLFCDSAGKLLRFKKEGRIHFAKEAGQQHWLTITEPPKCEIKITLNKIVHDDIEKYPAGYDWDLNWVCFVGGVGAQWVTLPHYDTSGWSDPDDWEVYPNSMLTFYAEGCCGAYPVVIMCQSIERDWPSADDIGTNAISLIADCSNSNVLQYQVETIINGNSNNRKSKITYFFSVQATCLG